MSGILIELLQNLACYEALEEHPHIRADMKAGYEKLDAFIESIPKDLGDNLDLAFKEYGIDCPLARGQHMRALALLRDAIKEDD